MVLAEQDSVIFNNNRRLRRAPQPLAKDAAGMTHYGPFHGREHAMQGAGAARPLDARECQYRSGTHFVPGRSYPVTDVLHTTDKETTSTEWQRKAIRKAVETPRATQMQGSLVAPEKPVEGPVYSKWRATGHANPGRSLSATASNVLNYGEAPAASSLLSPRYERSVPTTGQLKLDVSRPETPVNAPVSAMARAESYTTAMSEGHRNRVRNESTFYFG